MESEKINDIVEGTFTKVDLSVMNKHRGLNWKGQLQAVNHQYSVRWVE